MYQQGRLTHSALFAAAENESMKQALYILHNSAVVNGDGGVVYLRNHIVLH